TYSYRMGPSDIPEAWNVHTYQSNSSTYVLDYTSDALYTFEYNDDFSGYVIVPSMAAGDPVDVTAQYVGQYGVQEGDANKVYKIPLKTNLKFDNGEPITAKSFVDSMKLLLNPVAANYRADNVYQSGELKIYNAENYVKQNSYGLSEFVSENYGDDEYVMPSEFTTTEGGILQYNGMDIVLDLSSGGNWGKNGLLAYAKYGYLDVTVENDDGTLYALIDTATGEQVAWRTIAKVGEGDDAAYVFYDLENNVIEVTLNADKTAYVWGDKTLDFMTKTADCMTALIAAADDNNQLKLTAATMKNLQDAIAMLHGHADVEAYAAAAGDYAYIEFEEMAFFGQQYGSLEYEGNVGFFADGDYNLVIALKNPMKDNFFFRYELCSSFFLVYAPLYESLIKIEEGVYSNTYGTSVDTFVGFGPYKLTSYTEGAEIILERNLNWHGYTPEDYIPGTYQTDRVVYKKVTENSTRLEMFLKGELDSYGLQAEDMADYQGSDYTYYQDSESTWYLAMNPDMATLEANQAAASPVITDNTVIKTVLTIDDFRKALSYSLDRAQFILTLSPTSGIASSLLSSMIVADPESGLTYRSLDEAKDAILEFWGLADHWGEGKEYADRDEAIESITGYDPSGAKTLFNSAYTQAVEAGLISAEVIESGKWEVQIVIGKPADANFYNKGYEFLKAAWTEAVKGTSFEGHLTFVQSQTLGSTSFGDYLRDGRVDILFGVGYGGSMFNPYSMMECFTGSLEYDPFTDKTKVMMDVVLDGKTLRASAYEWVSECLQGDEITASVVGPDGELTGETVTLSAGSNDPAERRITILAAAEAKILTLANIFPLMTDASASLRCMRVIYKTEDYIVGMGRGGIEWYTYELDDAEFAAYVAGQPGGVLNYK
ncbi:MAG: ABC transporter substrate-binding protein, partial [Eubacteriales bacterium]